jgi:hypothetical protein
MSAADTPIDTGVIVDVDFLYPVLLNGRTWLLRPRSTDRRGRIALIAKGNRLVVGVANLVYCLGPLPREALKAMRPWHGLSDRQLTARKFADCRYAWILSHVRRLGRAVDYEHRPGSSTWVKLDPHAAEGIQRQLDT